ncbi:MAG: bifunctional demethylmenaquinone methyltransferase/2-methoxy-6-polyprenyl-1,4-benzoquinol methylase UbiE [Planctomycetota bacterium]
MTATETAHPFLDKEQRKIRTLFDRIAHRYDFLNHLLSFNMDKRWRRLAVEKLAVQDGKRYLDVCTGTGDLALELARLNKDKDITVIGSDFSVPMLQIGTDKCGEEGPRLLAGDTSRLPFPDGTFAGISVGFGIRNVENLEAGLAEMQRVLEPGGRMVILEFTPVRSRLMKPAFHLYCHGIVPLVGNLVSRSRERAYSYLQQSIDRWPTAEKFREIIAGVGFTEVGSKTLFPGNVALHWGRRQA